VGNKYDVVTIDLDGTISRVITEEYVLRELAPERLEKYYELEELLRENYQENYEKATTEQFKLLIGLKASDIRKVMMNIPLAKNIEKAISLLTTNGFEALILTDNIDVFCEAIKERIGIKKYISSKTIIRNDVITDLSELNLKKELGLLRYLRERNIDPKRVVHVGDWKNDISVFNQIGFGIAYRPKDIEVIEEAHLTINIEDFEKVARLIIAIDKC